MHVALHTQFAPSSIVYGVPSALAPNEVWATLEAFEMHQLGRRYSWVTRTLPASNDSIVFHNDKVRYGSIAEGLL